jgi:hypothetical protein
MTKLAFHSVALVMETLGTILVWLDAIRLNARNPARGVMLGDPPKYEGWWYHSSFVGFSLLLFGILLAAVSLFLEHKQLKRR